MLANESGYIFILLDKAEKPVGAFNRIEVALESIKMSGEFTIEPASENPMMLCVVGSDGFSVADITKVPISNIPMGFIL